MVTIIGMVGGERYDKHSLPCSLASSTRMISLSSSGGDLLITLNTVRNSVDQASLWNTMTTVVSGSFFTAGYCLFRQLQSTYREIFLSSKTSCKFCKIICYLIDPFTIKKNASCKPLK